MDTIFLKLLLVTILIFGAINNANADYVPTKFYKLAYPSNGIYYTDYNQACSDFLTHYQTTTIGRNYSISLCSSTLVRIQSNPINSNYEASTTITTWKDCGQGYVLWSTSPNGMCSGVQPPVCPSGQVVSSGYYDGGKNPSGSFPNVSCQSGCSVIFQGTWPFSQSNQADGMHYYAKGSYVKDGFTCSGSGTSPAASSSVPKSVEQQAADAAAAQAAAEKAAKAAADKAAADAKTAADKAVSAAAAQAAEAAKQAAEEAIKKAEASKAAADKAASDPNATQADKDAANTKAAADKAAADAAKQASSTAAGAAAAAQKDDTKPEQKDFCEKNPTSFICKTSAVNAGYCAPNGTVSGFSCDSDPVFCSMAQTQLQAYCLQNSRDEALVAAYNNMKNDTGSTNPANPANIQNINIPTTLNASSPYAGQCNPDVTISVGTTSATLPFSAWCPYLNALGYLFLAMAYMSAAVIISRT